MTMSSITASNTRWPSSRGIRSQRVSMPIRLRAPASSSKSRASARRPWHKQRSSSCSRARRSFCLFRAPLQSIISKRMSQQPQRWEMQLEGRVALVTGAASGIGRAVALAYAREGARVIVSDIDTQKGEETVRLVRASSSNAECLFVRADTASYEDHEALVAAAIERFGGLHVACNNAGIGGELNPIAEHSVEAWRKVIDINLSGVFYANKVQIAHMVKNGGGAIVNMASILGQAGTAGSVAYVAAKHGVLGLTKTAAIEYAARNVRINSVGPGYIDTPLLENLDAETRKQLVKLHPIGRLGRSEEVAELVCWLSSDRASFVNGAYYPVDGAYLAQ